MGAAQRHDPSGNAAAAARPAVSWRKRLRRLAEAARTERLLATEGLEIRALPGAGDSAVVVFGSLAGNFAKGGHLEFAGSASARGTRTSIFVRDTRKRWFQDPGAMEAVCETVAAYAARRGITRLMTLGDSMGGYGAVVFARPLGARVALAFSPQADVAPGAVPGDDRWMDLRAAIPQCALGPVDRWMGPEVSYYIFHGRMGPDILHWSRFPQGEHVHHFLMGGLQHSVAPVMKAEGRLAPIVELALADDAPALTALLAQNHGRPRGPGESHETNPNDWYRETGPQAAAGTAVHHQGEPT